MRTNAKICFKPMKSVIVILVFALVSCDVTTLEKKIAIKARECEVSCTISLKEITDFKWDKVYISDIPSTLQEINEAIGVEYSYYEEYTRPIIFFNKGKIVYHENNPSNIEGVISDQVIFGNATDTTKFRVYSVEEAVFKVRKRKSNSKDYYELIQLKVK